MFINIQKLPKYNIVCWATISLELNINIIFFSLLGYDCLFHNCYQITYSLPQFIGLLFNLTINFFFSLSLLGYDCLCVAGWEGDLCERERDECRTEGEGPCMNAAPCVDMFNDYRLVSSIQWLVRSVLSFRSIQIRWDIKVGWLVGDLLIMWPCDH